MQTGRASRIREEMLLNIVPVVFAAAMAGDRMAQTLVRRVGREVGVTAAAVIKKLGLENTEREVILAGGVFRGQGPLLLDTVVQTIHRFAPHAKIQPLKAEPVIGALILALEEIKGTIEESIQERLRSSLPVRGQPYAEGGAE